MKRCIYNFLVHASEVVLWPTQFFSSKMNLFIKGRQGVFQFLQRAIHPSDKVLWFHCASLGEYEQGLPIMQALKKEYLNHKLVLSFFSPSGYEVRKYTSIADVVCYLPLDTRANAKRFLEIVHPEMAFFVKYEFWPNYLQRLKKLHVPTFLISGHFRKNQSFFRSKGSILRESLYAFEHFFVQNQESLELLKGIGLNNVNVSGDTRFDRVSRQLEMDNRLDFMDAFKGNDTCLVCGSTWAEDVAILLPFLNSELGQRIKTVVAPHKIEPEKIKALQTKLQAPSVCFTDQDPSMLPQAKVLILDTVGVLSKVYAYADFAYVGGGMGTSGLHNILEPATFNVPVVIGKNFRNFTEAQELQELSGLFSVQNADDCGNILSKLTLDSTFRENAGKICGRFVKDNRGATEKIMQYLNHHYPIRT